MLTNRFCRWSLVDIARTERNWPQLVHPVTPSNQKRWLIVRKVLSDSATRYIDLLRINCLHNEQARSHVVLNTCIPMAMFTLESAYCEHSRLNTRNFASTVQFMWFEWGLSLQVVFTARCYASAVLAMGLCLSVCLSQVGVLLKRLNRGSHKQHTR